eukprot:1776116-Karenia_brevis.AAC.1
MIAPVRDKCITGTLATAAPKQNFGVLQEGNDTNRARYMHQPDHGAQQHIGQLNLSTLTSGKGLEAPKITRGPQRPGTPATIL